jgi:putative ABC transport system permease protein
VREAVERALRLDGHDVLLAADGHEALGTLDTPRALGTTRRHISAEFLTESLLLATLGGVAGAALGAAATAIYAFSRGWPTVVPPLALGGALAAALAIGAVAGLYPALRAARLPPTEALRSV